MVNTKVISMKFKRIKQISKGWSSYIWLCKIKAKNENNKLCVLKEVREKSPRKNLAEREGFYLKKANTLNVGPKLFLNDKKNNCILMEYIEGPRLFDWIMSTKVIRKNDLYYFIKELYKQLQKLDELHISHNQLQVGKNILVSTRKGKTFPVIIDFEKATTKEKTKNIGQIESFLFYNPNGAVAKRVREILQINL